MVKGKVNIQDQYLNQIRKEKIKIQIDVENGGIFEGVINSFDLFCVILTVDGFGPVLIYKSAIKSIRPSSLEDSKKIELF